MSLFCLCTSFALLFDYIFTFTLLAPVIFLCTPTKSEDPKQRSLLLNQPEEIKPQPLDPLKDIPSHIVKYSKFICSNKGRVITILLFIVMHIFAYWGVVTMKSTFEPSKAFPSDSPLTKSIDTVR